MAFTPGAGVQPLNQVRWFAALVPFTLFAAYFAALLATEGTNWRVHLWTGIVIEAGMVGCSAIWWRRPPRHSPKRANEEMRCKAESNIRQITGKNGSR